MFDEVRSEMIDSGLGVEFQSVTPTTVCGQPAEIADYTMTTEGISAPLSSKMLMAAAESENETHIGAVAVVTTEPDNPIYQRDSQAILDGFVFLPPRPGDPSPNLLRMRRRRKLRRLDNLYVDRHGIAAFDGASHQVDAGLRQRDARKIQDVRRLADAAIRSGDQVRDNFPIDAPTAPDR